MPSTAEETAPLTAFIFSLMALLTCSNIPRTSPGIAVIFAFASAHVDVTFVTMVSLIADIFSVIADQIDVIFSTTVSRMFVIFSVTVFQMFDSHCVR